MPIERRDTRAHQGPSRLVMLFPVILFVLCAVRPGSAQSGHDHAAHHGTARPDSTSDSAFAALQQRGKVEMGVDQYTSTHRFDDLADGGRIELTRDASDSAGVRTIREHLASIAHAFESGDFSTPFAVHAREVPGTKAMAAKRDAIRYEFKPLPGGGEVRISSKNPEAIRAIHAFMAFQRGDHRAGGEHH
ncbi:MAG TPA: hypothetical protein VFR95_12065 [Gemmatimonadaceae bacterium]|nr:hypothetical protein [Gemmatimonadaceae bacterium]